MQCVCSPQQHQERRLERIVHVVRVAQDLAADGQHHRTMSHDELAEGEFPGDIASPDKPVQ